MVVAEASSTLPVFVGLAGNPLRWRILAELAVSDRRVRELTAAIGEPQSLVSYHLGRLRDGGVVGVRRSSADGRDCYYSIDLARCGEMITAAGAALHPGLRLATVDGGSGGPGVAARRVPRVLFLCTGNSARSQMAEAFLAEKAGPRVRAFSAGSNPKQLHPNAVRVMRARGIDISTQRSKHLDQYVRLHFDHVITLCDRVREVCPELPGHPRVAHWSMPDPSSAGVTNRQTLPAFKQAADVIESRVRFLVPVIAQPRPRRSPP
jgi:protein-tyrosine-phosphatase/DNA-binding transcriptional ArsR family regulator